MPGFAVYLMVVISLIVAGCGIEELASSVPADLSKLERPSSPNTYLAGPVGFVPAPDLQTRKYDVSPTQLLTRVQGVIAAQPRTTALAFDGVKLRADYVARSLVFGFPDILLTQVLPTMEGTSALVLYSYSLKGYYDFGVNRRRVMAILAALDAALVRSH